MVALPQTIDPTLEAADRALADAQQRRPRPYLGMSQIGTECERALWYSFRWVSHHNFDAPTLKRFDDGHRGEDIIIARLKAVPGLELYDKGDDGQQFKFTDFGGHYSGSMDGAVRGLMQAPVTWHAFEAKVSEKWSDLDKSKAKVGEKGALLDWNPGYYAQAVSYMHYAVLDRHWLVAASPGVRRWTAVRTNADPAHALVLRGKAERVIFSDDPRPRIGDRSNFKCQWCDYAGVCHGRAPALRNCRTCLSVSVEHNGTWKCSLYGHTLTVADQEKGCGDHRYLPGLVELEQIDVRGRDIVYRTATGAEWCDRGQTVEAMP